MESQAQLDEDLIVKDTGTAYKKGGAQAWLVKKERAGCLVQDLVYSPLL